MRQAQDIVVLLRAAERLLAEALKTLEARAFEDEERHEPSSEGDSSDGQVMPTELDALRARRALRGVK